MEDDPRLPTSWMRKSKGVHREEIIRQNERLMKSMDWNRKFYQTLTEPPEKPKRKCPECSSFLVPYGKDSRYLFCGECKRFKIAVMSCDRCGEEHTKNHRRHIRAEHERCKEQRILRIYEM